MKVICIDDRAEFALDERGRPRPARPDERMTGALTIGKAYEVLAEEHGHYRIIDDSGEDYLYPKEKFRIAGQA